jgi:single-strand DNA-binding protein
MINAFKAVGNLGMAPTIKTTDESGNKVANLRVYFDRKVLDKQDEKYKDKGGFWLTVDVWGFRAEEAMRILKKGSRILVLGGLREVSWNDENGEERSEMRVTADYFFVDPVCIESIKYKDKSQKTSQG